MKDLVDMDLTVTDFFCAMRKEQNNTWFYEAKDRRSCGLTYFYKGVFAYSTADTTIRIPPNTVVWLPKGHTYSFRAIGDEDIGFVALSFMAVGKDLPFRVLRIPKNNKEIPCLFDEILTIALDKEMGYNLAVKSKISWLLYVLLQLCTDSSRPQIDSSADLKESLSYIHRHLEEKISLEQLSAISGYSQSYYRRRFQTEFGMPPVRYINLKRVERAKKLLLGGMYTKGEIAQLCGFENQQFFARVFKKYTGKRPSEYSGAVDNSFTQDVREF